MVTVNNKVFKALTDSSRRELLDRLRRENGLALGELCEGKDMSRQAPTKHLALPEAANLVVTQWLGREKLHYLNPVPINGFTCTGSARLTADGFERFMTLNKPWRIAISKSEFVLHHAQDTMPQKSVGRPD